MERNFQPVAFVKARRLEQQELARTAPPVPSISLFYLRLVSRFRSFSFFDPLRCCLFLSLSLSLSPSLSLSLLGKWYALLANLVDYDGQFQWISITICLRLIPRNIRIARH